MHVVLAKKFFTKQRRYESFDKLIDILDFCDYYRKLYKILQCCGSGMFIPDPGSWFLPIPDPGSQIPDPKTATKERGEKKFVVITFYVATNFTKLQIILVLKWWRKKFGPIFKEL
jgi:hypothetical protein